MLILFIKEGGTEEEVFLQHRKDIKVTFSLEFIQQARVRKSVLSKPCLLFTTLLYKEAAAETKITSDNRQTHFVLERPLEFSPNKSRRGRSGWNQFRKQNFTSIVGAATTCSTSVHGAARIPVPLECCWSIPIRFGSTNRRRFLAVVGLEHLLDLLVPLVVLVVRLRHDFVLLQLLLELLLPVCGKICVEAKTKSVIQPKIQSTNVSKRPTIRRRDAVLLVQHQLLHLFPQILLVDGRRVESVAHKLRHSGTRGYLHLILLRELKHQRFHFVRKQQDCTRREALTFFKSLMETGGVLALTLSAEQQNHNKEEKMNIFKVLHPCSS